MTLWGTVDAEIKVPSFENPELTNVLPFIKPEVGQNTSTHVLPTAINLFLVLFSTFQLFFLLSE